MYLVSTKRDYSLVEREFSNNMDRLQLIAEIYNRPGLWDLQSDDYKSRVNYSQLWQEVAELMGPDVSVEECKRKWKNLRDAYRAEIKRLEMRIERDILKGKYDPKNDYSSKWSYFDQMKFIKDIKRPRRSKICVSTQNTYHEDDDDMDEYDEFSEFQDIDDIIKKETDVEMNAVTSSLNDDINNSNNYSEKVSKGMDIQQTITQNLPKLTPAIRFNQDSLNTEKMKEDIPSCKCRKRSFDQMNFLEDLEKEEQILIKSTRLDISRTNALTHVGDSDYNFLVSFLPQLKKMNELQNLQFRAKMTEFVFTIMSQSAVNNEKPVPSVTYLG